ncbi:MAG: HpcH/HpaI aldolase family protein [Pseudomonadota bacterium]
MTTATLRARLRAGERLLATFCLVPSVEMVELIALAGFDAVILDTEHGPYGTGQLGPLILAARARGIAPIVRVRTGEASLIGAALDVGASGVLVPMVASRAAAEAVVRAARFAPEGSRGANPWVRAGDFGARAGWFAEANAEVAVIAMIEGEAGVEAAGDIVATPGLDAVFLGPVDLSHALGVPGEVDHPRVVETIEAVIEGASAQGLATALFTPGAERARHWFARGVGLVALGCDTAHALHGLRLAADVAKG